MHDKPLKGIRVADFSRLIAGPFCTMLLADLGADVVKIEPPEGDPIRMQGPPFFDGLSMGFMAVNRNKRSIAMNLKDEKSKDLVRRMVLGADIVVENFRPGVMDRLGLGYAEVSAENPRLIYASISGMGASGPLRDKGAFDLSVQAEAGFMSLTGEPGGVPIKLGTSVFDLVCGHHALGAIMAALYQREKTGQGMLIETSLFEGVMSYLVDAGMEWLAAGQLRPKWGSEHASNVPYKAFETNDGWIVIAAAVQRQFDLLSQVLGRNDLVDDPRFRRMQDRVTNRVALYGILDAEIKKRGVRELAAALDAVGVPCAPVNTLDEVFQHPQARARNMVVPVHMADGAELRLIGPAVKYSDFDVAENWAPPPKLGADNDDVIADWLGTDAGDSAAE